MKIIKITWVLAIVAITATSCVEKSGKYQALLAQRDSLLVSDQNYHQTLDILNDVETGFQAIRDAESTIFTQMNNAEGQPKTKKEQIVGQVNQIKDILTQNKQRIDELQKQLTRSGSNNRSLAETIKRLDAELNGKVAVVDSLRSELAKKNIKIEELSGTISGLSSNIADLNEVSAGQQETIAAQDKDLNNVAYIVANAKELKNLGILSGNGLFKSKTVMDREFDKTAFVQADLRKLESLPTDSKNPKILSSHPRDSYKLVAGADKMITMEIIDPAKFWSVSKYLVIQK